MEIFRDLCFFSQWVCVRVLPPRARSTCTAEAHQVWSHSRSPSGGGAEPLPVTEFLLPVYRNAQKVRLISKRHRMFSTLLANVDSATCSSSSVLKFRRWTSHGSEERSGRKGRSFGSCASPLVTIVIGGWERAREVRWASSDRCSTEAPPTSCQEINSGSETIRSIRKFQSSNVTRGSASTPEPCPSCPPPAHGTDSRSACCPSRPARVHGCHPAAASGPTSPPAHLQVTHTLRVRLG